MKCVDTAVAVSSKGLVFMSLMPVIWSRPTSLSMNWVRCERPSLPWLQPVRTTSVVQFFGDGRGHGELGRLMAHSVLIKQHRTRWDDRMRYERCLLERGRIYQSLMWRLSRCPKWIEQRDCDLCSACPTTLISLSSGRGGRSISRLDVRTRARVDAGVWSSLVHATSSVKRTAGARHAIIARPIARVGLIGCSTKLTETRLLTDYGGQLVNHIPVRVEKQSMLVAWMCVLSQRWHRRVTITSMTSSERQLYGHS